MDIARISIVGAAVILGLSGCAGDDAEVDTTVEEPAAEDGVTEAPADDAADDATEAAGEGPTVTVRDIAFQEQSVTVAAGTPVTWVNEDSVAHTVTSGTPDDATDVFDEELPAEGEVSITVDEPGTYPYWCRIHPNMTAELVVE